MRFLGITKRNKLYRMYKTEVTASCCIAPYSWGRGNKEGVSYMQYHSSDSSTVIVVGYVRRSSEMQKDNYSIDAQRRAIRDAAKLRGLPEPTFFEDDERSARGEQIAKRPEFKRLLDYIQANPGKVIVFVHTLDRWSRNVMVTLQ